MCAPCRARSPSVVPPHKKWAPRAHFAKPVKCGLARIATGNGRLAPREAGPPSPLDGGRALRRVRLQMTDHVGDVGQFLLEVALVLLEPAQPLFPVREGAPPAAEAAVVMSVSVHVHLPSS